MAAFSGRCEAYLALFNVKFQKFVMVAVFILDYRRVVVFVNTVYCTHSECFAHILASIQIITAQKPTEKKIIFFNILLCERDVCVE